MAAFRTLTIRSRCKLEVQLNYLVIRAEEEKRVLLDELSTLIIANVQCSMTAAALSQLMDHGVKVIFCDPKWNPQGELIPYHQYHAPLQSLKRQLSWADETKSSVWQTIVKAKLTRQAMVLQRKRVSDVADLILNYVEQVEPGDATNREGLGAKVYFEALFNLGFNRHNPMDRRNIYLDYGYSIILSAVNRAIAASGYLLQLGIHHRGESNPFNLGCDLVEPLRPFIDARFLDFTFDDDNYKQHMKSVLGDSVGINGRTSILSNAIDDYVQTVFNALNESDPSKCQFIYPVER